LLQQNEHAPRVASAPLPDNVLGGTLEATARNRKVSSHQTVAAEVHSEVNDVAND
jgi:hypothetical protein